MNSNTASKIAITAGLAALALGSAGCNTVKGVGRDIQSVGEAGEKAISQAPETAEQDTRDAL